jgi:hypothetical protein
MAAALFSGKPTQDLAISVGNRRLRGCNLAHFGIRPRDDIDDAAGERPPWSCEERRCWNGRCSVVRWRKV